MSPAVGSMKSAAGRGAFVCIVRRVGGTGANQRRWRLQNQWRGGGFAFICTVRTCSHEDAFGRRADTGQGQRSALDNGRHGLHNLGGTGGGTNTYCAGCSHWRGHCVAALASCGSVLVGIALALCGVVVFASHSARHICVRITRGVRRRLGVIRCRWMGFEARVCNGTAYDAIVHRTLNAKAAFMRALSASSGGSWGCTFGFDGANVAAASGAARNLAALALKQQWRGY
ncbi:hypothetical protein B0H19DRAFT_1067187 [Mycena capillaripes]|nr:hypothetical protein B0H19DRAFT_1067187 [Mycena capillaripes]